MSDLTTAREALEAAKLAMEGVTIFVTSKERIKRPEGDDWWSDQIEKVRQASAALSTLNATAPTGQTSEPADEAARAALVKDVREFLEELDGFKTEAEIAAEIMQRVDLYVAALSRGEGTEDHSSRAVPRLSQSEVHDPIRDPRTGGALVAALRLGNPVINLRHTCADLIERLYLEQSPHPSAGAPSREALSLLIAGWPAHQMDLGSDNEVIGDRVSLDRDQSLGEVPRSIERLADRIRALYATPPGEQVEDKHSRAVPLSTIRGENEIGAAELAVGRYVYRLIEARMDAQPGTREFVELDYLSAIVADVEEYGADELSIGELRATPGSPKLPLPGPPIPDEGSPANEGRRDTTESSVPLSAIEGWTNDDLEPAARALFESTFMEETWEDCLGLHDDVFASLRAAIAKLPLPAPPAQAEGGE